MRRFNAIFNRELRGYFDSPIAYIFLIVFLVVNCGLYMSSFFLIGRAEMRSLFSLLPLMLVVFIPAITMRLWAEEKKQGTIELLLTFPMSTWQIVLGKFFAALMFFSLALAGTLPIPFLLNLLGEPDMGPIIGGYIGSLFLGSFYLSIGLFLSGFSRDQIVAFILATVTSFVFFLAGIPIIVMQLDGWTGFLELGTKLQNYLSVTHHFEGIQRGVVDVKNIIYFGGMTLLFLLLNTWFMETRLRRGGKVKAAISGLIIFGVVIFANVVASRIEGGRFDFTENKLYTVSDSAKNVLSSLKAPVKVKYYVTSADGMPTEMKSLEQDVKDKLEEFRLASNKKLTYEIFNPTGEGEMEEKLQKLNVNPIQVQSIDRDEIGVKLIYSALTISYLDKKEELIPAIHPQNLGSMEYELISKIYKLASIKKPKVSIMASVEEVPPELIQFYLQARQEIPQPKKMFTNLEEVLGAEDYDVQTIALDKESPIPEGTDTLIILRPIKLNERQRYEISRFLQKGGNVILAVQNYEYDYNPRDRKGVQVVPKKIEPEINPLLQGYGITIEDGLLMDESHEVLMIPTRQNIMGLFSGIVNTPVKIPIQIMIESQNLNKDVSITNHISDLLFLWGSSLKIDEEQIKKSGLSYKVLASTSERAWIAEDPKGALSSKEIEPPQDGFKKNLPVAAILEGKFPDLYAGKEVPQWPAQESETKSDISPELPEKAETVETKSGKLILIGGAKMFDDSLIQAAKNGMFMMNAVDALSLGEDIINLRGKTQTDRLIPKADTFTKLWSRFLTIFLMPILITIAGVIRFVLRKREKEHYLQIISVAKERF